MTATGKICFFIVFLGAFNACKKADSNSEPAPVPTTAFQRISATIDGTPLNGAVIYNVHVHPTMKLSFNKQVDRTSASNAVMLKQNGSTGVPVALSYENGDSTVVLVPTSNLSNITKYQLSVTTALKSTSTQSLNTAFSANFITRIDSTDKFPLISDDALLTKVQQQTFKYFWDFGHPVSGLARERNNSAETVTTGGSGFGVMALIVGINRGFITRAQGLTRMQTIVGFLKNTAQRFHGAYPHWLNGTTGQVIPFSANDDGADLVETSYLMQGLVCARQYFNQADAAETTLRSDINSIINGVEWDWFRQGGQDVLYWHWSPNVGWAMNMPVRGYNECLITYVMAASSSTHSIPPVVYTNGWANGGTIVNGSTYYGYTLPLGQPNGGPLFFAHYSFLGMDPTGLADTYGNYWTQNVNHTKINRAYCIANPLNMFGYSNLCWGLTASDIPNGYSASSPNNDLGVIAPTAAVSSMPYTPAESMDALKFFYYKLGDKLWGEYGFYDAFALKDAWFANSTLAIDQGPMIIMIENYRSQLLWDLFTSAPEIVNGMQNLGFTAPYL
jgi:hypothetical protein